MGPESGLPAHAANAALPHSELVLGDPLRVSFMWQDFKGVRAEPVHDRRLKIGEIAHAENIGEREVDAAAKAAQKHRAEQDR